jgi:exosortase/archaeosortase
VASQSGCFVVRLQRFLRSSMPVPRKLARPTAQFCCRVGLVAVFVGGAYQMSWNWLRFVTSECVLRISAWLGMTTLRLSFDTIRVGGQATQYVIACTFVDVFMGAIPLLWNLKNSVLRNGSLLVATAGILFGFNVVRLELAQVLHCQGVPWTVADEVLGGVAYFVVWLAIWRLRSWEVWTSFAESEA